MKKQLLYFGFFLVILSVFLYSCSEEKNIRYFNMNIELNEPIPGLKENDPLPAYFKILVNYIDTNCSKDLLVPIVTFKRNDLKQPNTLKLKAPLSWINDFRSSREMLPSEYLREDYDKLIADIKAPKIIVDPKGAIVEAETLMEDNKNIFTLNIKASSIDSLAILKEKIAKRLCETKGSVTVNVRVINSVVNRPIIPPLPPDNKTLIAKADSLYSIKKLQDALKIFNEVLKLEPTNNYVIERIRIISYELRIPPGNSTPGSGNSEILPGENNIKLTANSLEEYFQKIGDNKIDYNNKKNLKKEIIEKYFESEKSQVIEMGKNGTEVNHTNIKDLVEDLSQRNLDVNVLDKKTNNNQKITTLTIKQL